ncbi:type II toxin-antitoxin system HigB family toxin [Paraburkholderia megapolitana]|uniref:mRNA interferase HigB n=1 Tax=Paraburkholderia megapolitana TaxID=420953 RepID=A0A1I3DZF1_9BURK|nr:type II toxin-antitoxin system HigB family toxin [Paraburkholderia megapolitana]QDQ79840.1 type II toxin-antitoxin system HigB family toxin [Paraburkholderia megapolitana]SFH91989.1 mRNA interferase HigB [Paraburkholderia megapolitana]
MRVISNKTLVDFSVKHPDAGIPLQIWRKTVEAVFFANFADLKRAFNTVDKVGDLYVFNIGGNKFRLIAAVHFNVQKLYVRHVFTHKEYDKWKR